MLSQRQIEKAIVGIQDIFTQRLLLICIILLVIYIAIKVCTPRLLQQYKGILAVIAYVVILFQIMWLGRVSSQTVTNIEWVPFIRIYDNGVLHETRLIGAILNILIYIPYGYLLESTKKCKWISIGMVLCTTLIIEYGQYACVVGTFKIENLITNTLGGVVGMALYSLIDKRRKND